jgi:hypothetical protein
VRSISTTSSLTPWTFIPVCDSETATDISQDLFRQDEAAIREHIDEYLHARYHVAHCRHSFKRNVQENALHILMPERSIPKEFWLTMGEQKSLKRIYRARLQQFISEARERQLTETTLTTNSSNPSFRGTFKSAIRYYGFLAAIEAAYELETDVKTTRGRRVKPKKTRRPSSGSRRRANYSTGTEDTRSASRTSSYSNEGYSANARSRSDRYYMDDDDFFPDDSFFDSWFDFDSPRKTDQKSKTVPDHDKATDTSAELPSTDIHVSTQSNAKSVSWDNGSCTDSGSGGGHFDDNSSGSWSGNDNSDED